MKHTLLFFISIYCALSNLNAQETTPEQTNDTIGIVKEKYGLRVGGDLSKIARTAFEKGYTGFEIIGDFRISKRFFAAAELGTEDREWNQDDLKTNTKGSYIKIGADFNAYQNWLGMDNMIAVGLRYGFSTFSQDLISYPIFTTDPTFPTEIRTDGSEFSGLTASWAELIIAIKTELVNNLYLSINLQLKRMINEQQPEDFDNLIVPGFNRTYDFSEFGVGYGYTLSYVIPLFKK